jgi:hypothetical protein
MGARRPCSGIGGAEEEECLKSSSPRLLHRVANGPNVMSLRIRSLPDPISSSLNSPLSASRILVNCGHFFYSQGACSEFGNPISEETLL